VAHIDRRNRNGTLRYVARYVDPGGRERSKSFPRRKDAEAYLTEVEAAKLKGTWVDPAHGRTRFRDWHAEWWPTLYLRPTTRVRDDTWYRLHVLSYFGDMPLDAIRQRDMRAWVAQLTARGLAPATVVKIYQLFAKVMTAAVDAGLLTASPCRGISLPKVEQEEMRYLNPAEIAYLAEVIRRPIGRWCSSAPTAGCASGNWPGCAAPASTWTPARSTWPRTSPRSRASSTAAHPRPGPAAAA
jgi:Phage integrase, N-terminal SAM-like domain